MFSTAVEMVVSRALRSMARAMFLFRSATIPSRMIRMFSRSASLASFQWFTTPVVSEKRASKCLALAVMAPLRASTREANTALDSAREAAVWDWAEAREPLRLDRAASWAALSLESLSYTCSVASVRSVLN